MKLFKRRKAKEINANTDDKLTLSDCYSSELFGLCKSGLNGQPLEWVKQYPKRIVDGLIYDTSKAEYITDVYVDSEFDRLRVHRAIPEDVKSVKLYKGKNNFFIVCKNRIVPVSEDWVQYHLEYKVDIYIKLFGEVEEA